MSSYKQPCRFCGELLERSSRFCHSCGSCAPFTDLCPTCLKPISRKDFCCTCCGRKLYINCPQCKGNTFAGDKCEVCGASLLKKCSNPRCGEMQFFENKKCNACGKLF